jgi:tRNA U34 2-thiouridine synthase MnmA/TrmU
VHLWLLLEILTRVNGQKGIASGQFVAWYQGEECIGSGTIF